MTKLQMAGSLFSGYVIDVQIAKCLELDKNDQEIYHLSG